MSIYYSDDKITLHHGDCLEVLASLPDASVDAVVTDPPYGLEFMGKGWDAPWRGDVSDVNADAGMSATGYTDGGKRLARPSFTGSTNPKCLTCKGTRRGRRDGTAKVAVCLCADGGTFPNVRATEMRAFGAWCEQWTAECLRVLKPGGHLLAFGGTRTWHRLAVAVEDAGFEIRDSIAWMYGSGFPKSMDVSKAIATNGGRPEDIRRLAMGDDYTPSGRGRVNYDHGGGSKMNGSAGPISLTPEAEQWQGWGTALKPAFEPIVMARKPLIGTVAATVLEHGTGALNIDGCRIGAGQDYRDKCASVVGLDSNRNGHAYGEWAGVRVDSAHESGRWPANVILDESQAAALDQQAPATGDRGGVSRFFYVAKAPKSERPIVDGVAHPTVKPVALMQWLVRLVTPPGGTVLEPFAGSGTTVEACMREGFDVIAIEREADYLPLITARIDRELARQQDERDSHVPSLFDKLPTT